MIAIRKLSWFVSIILAASLTACGGSDGDGAPPPGGGGGGGGGTPQSVEMEQLNGTWFGTFYNNRSTQTFQFDIQDQQITNVQLNGVNQPGISGSVIERADEVGEGARAFRFEAQAGSFDLTGVLILDPSATYMVYLYTNRQFGVLQKGASEMPAEGFSADAIAGNWSGITVRAPTVVDPETPLSPVEQVNSSAECTTAEDDTSECAITIGDASKTATGLTLAEPALGRWSGSYEGGGSDSARALLSADSNFAGVWGCTDTADGFPENCDFSAWTKGSAE